MKNKNKICKNRSLKIDWNYQKRFFEWIS